MSALSVSVLAVVGFFDQLMTSLVCSDPSSDVVPSNKSVEEWGLT